MYTITLFAKGRYLVQVPLSRVTQALLTYNQHGDESLQIEFFGASSQLYQLYASNGMLEAQVCWRGRAVWQGRVENPQFRITQNQSTMRLTALGHWRAATDDPLNGFVSATDNYGEWIEGTPALVFDNTPDKYNFQTSGELSISAKSGETYSAGSGVGRLHFVIDAAPALGMKGIQFEAVLTGNSTSVTWQAGFQAVINTTTTSTEWALNFAAGAQAQTVHINLANVNAAHVCFYLFPAAGSGATPVTNDQIKLRILHLRLVGDTDERVNTTAAIASGTGASVVVTPASMQNIYVGQKLYLRQQAANSQVTQVQAVTATTFTAQIGVALAVGATIQSHFVSTSRIARILLAGKMRNNPHALRASQIGIEDSGTDIYNARFQNNVYPEQILTDFAALGNRAINPEPFVTGVRNGLFYFRPKSRGARTWYVNTTELAVERQIDQLRNAVFMFYSGIERNELVTGGPYVNSDSRERYLTRVLHFYSDSTIADVARTQGLAQLADGQLPKPATAIKTRIIYRPGGIRGELHEVQNGDKVVLQNLSPIVKDTGVDAIRVLTVLRTEVNMLTGWLTIYPESLPSELEFILGRLAAGVGGM